MAGDGRAADGGTALRQGWGRDGLRSLLLGQGRSRGVDPVAWAPGAWDGHAGMRVALPTGVPAANRGGGGWIGTNFRGASPRIRADVSYPEAWRMGRVRWRTLPPHRAQRSPEPPLANPVHGEPQGCRCGYGRSLTGGWSPTEAVDTPSAHPGAAIPIRCLGLLNIQQGGMVLPERIELSTSPFPWECSTTELRQRTGPQARAV